MVPEIGPVGGGETPPNSGLCDSRMPKPPDSGALREPRSKEVDYLLADTPGDSELKVRTCTAALLWFGVWLSAPAPAFVSWTFGASLPTARSELAAAEVGGNDLRGWWDWGTDTSRGF